MKTNKIYLSNLTTLRGIAALLTVIFHVDLMLGFGVLVKMQDSMLLTRMYLMVDFFFVLSGFIIYHVYASSFKDSLTKQNFKSFTIARFARVYPLHFYTLFYCIVLKLIFVLLKTPINPMDAISNNFWTIPSHLLLLHSMNLNEWFTWNNASWSISTEWWMYMLFPFLVMPFAKLKLSGKIVLIFFCISGYLAITYLIVPIVTVPEAISFTAVSPEDLSINVSYQYGFLRCLFGFVLGMLTYDFYVNEKGKKILSNGYIFIVFTIGLFACMHFTMPDYVTVFIFPLIVLSAAYGSDYLNKILNIKALQKLGDWSFSIYLVHQPLLYTIGGVLTYINQAKSETQPSGPPPPLGQPIGWAICLAFIVVTLFVSFLSFRYLEVPSRNYLNRKFNKKIS